MINLKFIIYNLKFKKILLSLGFFCGALFFAQSAFAADIYITQNTSGADTGANCTNAHSAAWFNNIANWGTDLNDIAPGDTVHLCGTFVFPADDKVNGLLNIRGSGAPGSPITILFEANAKLQSPQFSTYGALMCHYYHGCHGNIVIDGGTNGVIENTTNGTGLAYHAASNGMLIAGWWIYTLSNVEVKNLTIRNIYLNAGSSPDATDINGRSTQNISIIDNLENVSIHDCTFSSARTGINGSFGGKSWKNIDIYNNFVSDHCWGINLSGLSTSSIATDIKIHNNEITEWTNWQCPASAKWCTDKTDVYHTDGIILWSGNTPGTPVFAPLIYNNYIHGHLGRGSPTGFIYCTVGNPIANTTSGSECIIFNNLLVGENGGLGRVWFGGNTKNNKLYNNTFIGIDPSLSSTFNPCIISSSLGGDVYKNNICVNFSQIFATQWAGDPAGYIAEMDNNIYWNFNTPDPNKIVFGNGRTYSIEQWRALGYDVNSVFTDPKLDATYNLASGSSAIKAGANLSSVGIGALNYDKAGKARAGVGAWDIGAYAYTQLSGDTAAPAAPAGLRIS